MLLRKVWARMPVRGLKISISRAYFYAVKTASDFFNRIGRMRPVAKGRRLPKLPFTNSQKWLQEIFYKAHNDLGVPVATSILTSA